MNPIILTRMPGTLPGCLFRGPTKKRKTLVSDDGGFAFNAISISVFQLQTLLEDFQIQDRYVLQIQ